ncbi:LOG family protein [Phormidesmis sp. 146-12]
MKAICVFCVSSMGANPAYQLAAQQLGETLATKGLTLVYGGGNVGLMGVVADATLAAVDPFIREMGLKPRPPLR